MFLGPLHLTCLVLVDLKLLAFNHLVGLSRFCTISPVIALKMKMPADTSSLDASRASNNSTTSSAQTQGSTVPQSPLNGATSQTSTNNSSEPTAAPPPPEDEHKLPFRATLGCVAMNKLYETASPVVIELLSRTKWP
ncbi:hypothetical protein HGRIS_000050 [Hohenbuehelia grisea]|uniref:Uncharacterized protein n=1 Tax=Hohenbuehelia grisea TaxID=104357 RepID=A0ABR3JS15_9AGAR